MGCIYFETRCIIFDILLLNIFYSGLLITNYWFFLINLEYDLLAISIAFQESTDRLYWCLGSLMVRVQSQVKSYQRLKKMYWMPLWLTLSIIRYGSRVKWSNSGEGVAPSPTLRCSSDWKGRFRVTLDYGIFYIWPFFLYFAIYFYIFNLYTSLITFPVFGSLQIVSNIYSHPQTDYFVVSQLFRMARHARFPKLGSKHGWLKRQCKILPLAHEVTSGSGRNLNAYVIHLFCLHI